MADLLITTFVPRLGTGRDLRTYATIRALAMHGPLDVAWIPHGGDEPAPELQAIDGVSYHCIKPSRGARRVAMYAGKRILGVPNPMARSCSPEIVSETRRLAAVPGRARVIASDINAMTALIGLARRRPVIYQAQNVESSYRAVPDEPRVRWLPIEVLERRLLRAASETWMVSHLDIERAAAMVPGTRLRYVPNVVDVDAIEPATPPGSGPPIVLMLGDFTYGPNIEGLQHLEHEIMPAVWEKVPEARLRLAGRGLDDHPPGDERIDRLGFVEHLRDVYAGVSVITVPLLEGGGSPLKFIEGMAFQLPVVATPRAAQGLDARPDEHYREAAAATPFADQIVSLLRAPDPAMAARARALVEHEYSIQALARLVAP